MFVVLGTRDTFPYLFTASDAVAKETTRISILLAFTVLLNSLQPVLSGKQMEVSLMSLCLVFLFILLDFIVSLRGCHWSGMAITCCIHKYCLLLFLRTPCWHYSWIQIRVWWNGNTAFSQTYYFFTATDYSFYCQWY